MNNSRLPIDICEEIIDSLWERPWADSKTLQACALTCTNWLPRSRLVLYRRVKFDTPKQVEQFIRTIDEQSFLAESVKILRVYISKTYLPFARPYLLRRLCNLRRLEVWYGLQQRTNCPITYNWQYLICGFAITQLELGGHGFTSWSDVFRLIWSLRTLQNLSLCNYHHDRIFDGDDLTDHLLARLSVLRRPWSCQNLTTLHIGGNFLVFRNFPPPHAFGSNVRVLRLRCPARVPKSYQNLLDQIALFHSLQEIEFSQGWDCGSDNFPQLSRWVCDILCAVQDPRTLHEISLPDWASKMHRHKFLDTFWTGALCLAMTRFDNLQCISVDVRETLVSDKDDVWWTERIVERIPGLVHLLKVTVTRVSRGDWLEEDTDPDHEEDQQDSKTAIRIVEVPNAQLALSK